MHSSEWPTTGFFAQPEFAESPDHSSFGAAESNFSPNALTKLDLTQASAPAILEDDRGAISGARDMAVHRTGASYSGGVLPCSNASL